MGEMGTGRNPTFGYHYHQILKYGQSLAINEEIFYKILPYLYLNCLFSNFTTQFRLANDINIIEHCVSRERVLVLSSVRSSMN